MLNIYEVKTDKSKDNGYIGAKSLTQAYELLYKRMDTYNGKFFDSISKLTIEEIPTLKARNMFLKNGKGSNISVKDIIGDRLYVLVPD